MSAGDRGKHFKSQRYMSGECTAGFREEKKKEERKQGTESRMWLPRDGDRATSLTSQEVNFSTPGKHQSGLWSFLVVALQLGTEPIPELSCRSQL